MIEQYIHSERLKIIQGDNRIVYHVGTMLPNQGDDFLLVRGTREAQGPGIYCLDKPWLRYSGGEKDRQRLERTPIYCIPLAGEWVQGRSIARDADGENTYHTNGRLVLFRDIQSVDADLEGKPVRYYISLHPVFFKEPSEENFWKKGGLSENYRRGSIDLPDVIPDLMKHDGKGEERVPKDVVKESLIKAIEQGMLPNNKKMWSILNATRLGIQYIDVQDKSMILPSKRQAG